MRRGLLLLAVAAVAAPLLPGIPAARGDPAPCPAGGPARLVTAAPPAGVGACPGVRPGGFLYSPERGGLCTYNFLFDGSDGRRYIGTAGHCILGTGATVADVGEKSWGAGQGPIANSAPEPGLPVSGDERVGEFAYAVLEYPKDFALIRIDPGVEANPEMCHFGGPTGINDDLTFDPVVLHYFGGGLGLGALVPARTALATSMPDPDEVLAAGPAVQGDSGAGVISDDGRAVGVLTNLGAQFRLHGEGAETGPIGITRIGPQIARAEEVLGLTLTLVTA